MCGLIGISSHKQAARLAYHGLFALQHRGQEAAGIVTAKDGQMCQHLGRGLVTEAISEEAIGKLVGPMAIAHVRYSTAGTKDLVNAQPMLFRNYHGKIAIAHNGNLTNALTLKRKLEEQGAIFQSTSDTEVVIHLIARKHGKLLDCIVEALGQLEGSYSFLLMTPDWIMAARDPYGFRPLVLGKLGRSFLLASETAALELLEAKFLREIAPGEVVIFKGTEQQQIKQLSRRTTEHKQLKIQQAFCVFEHVYFARPDSDVFGRNVYEARKAMGRELAKQLQPLKADYVIPIPDSGVSAALGFSEASGIPMELGLIRNHYAGRTFIQPLQSLRELGVRLKLSPLQNTLKGKKIILIDDSIVRGTTARKIIRMLRKAKVKEIHMAISSPPIISPCFYGIDTPREEELLAANMNLKEIKKFLGVDSIQYLSVEGLLRSVHGDKASYCTACFTKKYPTPLTDRSQR